MALFGKRKVEETAAAGCSCQGKCTAAETATPANACAATVGEKICCVKVLGAGCKSCHALLENTQSAVKMMGLSLDVEYITDMQKIMAYGVMRMPALVVNEKIVSMGRVLKTGEVEALLRGLHG